MRVEEGSSVFEGGSNGQADRDDGHHGNADVRRILVVEDEALICVDTADTLEHLGFEVYIALSAEDALRRLRGGLAIDILFTDINLAGPMTGETLAVLCRELKPDVTVVYTSGTVAVPSHRVEGSRFVAKPYNPERVGRLIDQMCAAHV
jgi:DNA-binding NtrC family response regulator